MKNTSFKWGRFLYNCLLLMVVWYAFTVSLTLAEIIIGLIVTGIIAALNFTSFTHYGFRLFHPRRIMYLLQYSFVFMVAQIKAYIQVAAIVLNPKLPLKPGIVKINYPAASRRGIKRNTFPNSPQGSGNKTLEISRLRLGSVQLNIFTALSFVKI